MKKKLSRESKYPNEHHRDVIASRKRIFLTNTCRFIKNLVQICGARDLPQ